jgi:hypothetical protein
VPIRHKIGVRGIPRTRTFTKRRAGIVRARCSAHGSVLPAGASTVMASRVHHADRWECEGTGRGRNAGSATAGGNHARDAVRHGADRECVDRRADSDSEE